MAVETLTSLINLGAAGAVIAVVVLFLRNNRERDNAWRDFFTELNRQNCADNLEIMNNQKSIMSILSKITEMIARHDRDSLARVTTVSQTAKELLETAAHVAAKKVLDDAMLNAKTQPRQKAQ